MSYLCAPVPEIFRVASFVRILPESYASVVVAVVEEVVLGQRLLLAFPSMPLKKESRLRGKWRFGVLH